jgi:hypothetical protein
MSLKPRPSVSKDCYSVSLFLSSLSCFFDTVCLQGKFYCLYKVLPPFVSKENTKKIDELGWILKVPPGQIGYA